jgi:hypothetical protein
VLHQHPDGQNIATYNNVVGEKCDLEFVQRNDVIKMRNDMYENYNKSQCTRMFTLTAKAECQASEVYGINGYSQSR